MARPFWESKTLAEMSDAEWESLCDGCGRCCLVVLQEEETDRYWETEIACRLFDAAKRRCTDYQRRRQRVKDCVRLTPDNAGALDWMPSTCAYRRLARRESLPKWHPLLTGDPQSVVRAGAATAPGLLNERDVAPEDLEDHVTRPR